MYELYQQHRTLLHGPTKSLKSCTKLARAVPEAGEWEAFLSSHILAQTLSLPHPPPYTLGVHPTPQHPFPHTPHILSHCFPGKSRHASQGKKCPLDQPPRMQDAPVWMQPKQTYFHRASRVPSSLKHIETVKMKDGPKLTLRDWTALVSTCFIPDFLNQFGQRTWKMLQHGLQHT